MVRTLPVEATLLGWLLLRPGASAIEAECAEVPMFAISVTKRLCVLSSPCTQLRVVSVSPFVNVPSTSALARTWLVAYEAPLMSGMRSVSRAIGVTCPAPDASVQNSFLPRAKVIESMVPRTATPTSPLPSSGASVWPVVSTWVGAAFHCPLYRATIRVACAHVVGSLPDPEELLPPELPVDEPLPPDEELPPPDEEAPPEEAPPEEALPLPEDAAPLELVAPLLDATPDSPASDAPFAFSGAPGEPQCIVPRRAMPRATTVGAHFSMERAGCIA